LDNHYIANSQGAMIGAVMAERARTTTRLTRLGIEDVPHCGAPGEVLAAHQLDTENLAKRIHAAVFDIPGHPAL